MRPVDGSWTASLGGIELRFGSGARHQAADVLAAHGIARPLLVTDAGVRATGRVDQIDRDLRDAGVRAHILDAVHENPTTDDVENGVAQARGHDIDGILAVGGGSVMDTAKGVNFVLTNGGRMQDYEGRGRASRSMLPAIGVPTTAGTGSEAQSFALIARADDHRKMACGDPKARFRAVLLDPELLATVPPAVASASGVDAIAHAVESHVSRAANPVSRLYSGAAWELLDGALADHLARPHDPAVAGRMLLGAHLAGAAIECSMLGAAHACANPLTARFDLTHGIAVGVMLPHVVRYNREDDPDRYAGRLRSAPERVATLLQVARIAPRLRDHAIPEEALPALARDAARQWTAGFNPRPVSEAELLELYRHAF